MPTKEVLPNRRRTAVKVVPNEGFSVAPPGPTDGLLAENGDFLQTESGDYLVQE